MKQVRQFTRLPCLQMPVGTHLSITHPLSESGRRFAVTDLEGSFVTNVDSLAEHYAKPTERLLKKRLDHVNAVGRAFIAASPICAMPKGAGPVRPVEGGKWRPATRRADAGRLRGSAGPGNKRCRVRRSIQPKHSE